MINEIHNFLSSFPKLSGMLININHLDSKAGAVSLESSPQKNIIREYTDGEKLYSQDFTLAIRQVFSQSISSNSKAAELCESFSSWLEEQSRNGNLPILGEGLIPISILPQGAHRVTSVSGSTVRYEIPFRLYYRESIPCI